MSFGNTGNTHVIKAEKQNYEMLDGQVVMHLFALQEVVGSNPGGGQKINQISKQQ